MKSYILLFVAIIVVGIVLYWTTRSSKITFDNSEIPESVMCIEGSQKYEGENTYTCIDGEWVYTGQSYQDKG